MFALTAVRFWFKFLFLKFLTLVFVAQGENLLF